MILARALSALRPDANWSISGETIDGIIWHDDESTRPPDEEINAKVIELQNLDASLSYQIDRKYEYPDIKDFADAYYWAQKGNTTLMDAYIAKCDAVKAKYPKS